jgi:hypothetical protein
VSLVGRTGLDSAIDSVDQSLYLLFGILHPETVGPSPNTSRETNGEKLQLLNSLAASRLR